ncbi:MAG: hypothetical protein F6J93_19405 [Oscillatoria sp. SIO1A7]|nr:hypothetical protein [Oscillatoria sp. SIO1A7]
MAILAKYQDEIRDFEVKSLAIFGSVARDEARPDSDVDILVDFSGTITCPLLYNKRTTIARDIAFLKLM